MGKMTINGMARRIAGLTEDPDKSAALADYLGIQPNGIIHTYGDCYKVIQSGEEYLVCKGEDEADREAYESVRNVIDDCGYAVVNGWEQFIDWDFFDEDIQSFYTSYCEDIALEPDDEFGNRLGFFVAGFAPFGLVVLVLLIVGFLRAGEAGRSAQVSLATGPSIHANLATPE